MNINLKDLDALVFDFDGVLTDNRVFLNEDGNEFVSCHRGDGLAFNVLNTIGIKTFIISSEKNKVVSARAKKLEIQVIQGVENKVNTLRALEKQENISAKNILYIGNDLNDFDVMKLCGYTACPSDSHYMIIENSDIVLETKGGMGVARELVEQVLEIDMMLYI